MFVELRELRKQQSNSLMSIASHRMSMASQFLDVYSITSDVYGITIR